MYLAEYECRLGFQVNFSESGWVVSNVSRTKQGHASFADLQVFRSTKLHDCSRAPKPLTSPESASARLVRVSTVEGSLELPFLFVLTFRFTSHNLRETSLNRSFCSAQIEGPVVQETPWCWTM